MEGDNEQRSEIEREREREKELCVSLSCFGCFSCSSSFFSLSTVREIQCRKRYIKIKNKNNFVIIIMWKIGRNWGSDL